MFIFLAFVVAALVLSWYTSNPQHIGKWTDLLWWLSVIGGGLSLAGMILK